jgi:UDP-N-acetylglucosamine 2-epimerase (non-hydrolysing)
MAYSFLLNNNSISNYLEYATFIICPYTTFGYTSLLKEGISLQKIHLVGHVMIDTLLRNKQKAEKSNILDSLNLNGDTFAVLTLHRPSNVDDPVVFGRILDAIKIIQNDMPVIFPIHPRTRKNFESNSIGEHANKLPGLRLVEPLGYLDFLKLMSNAKIVLTDSGGIQEETTILNIPCLTLRENTERPITTELGTNQVVGTNPTAIIQAYQRAVNGTLHKPMVPPLWDGRAAERIVGILLKEF